jgi:hypothetical protein
LRDINCYDPRKVGQYPIQVSPILSTRGLTISALYLLFLVKYDSRNLPERRPTLLLLPSRSRCPPSSAKNTAILSQYPFGLDLVVAIAAPHDQPRTGSGGAAKCRRRASVAVHRRRPRPWLGPSPARGGGRGGGRGTGGTSFANIAFSGASRGA